MKKLFYAMALLVFVLVLPSCGSKDDDDEPKDTPKTETADVTFWTDDDVYENVEVNLWKYDDSYDQYRYISSYYSSIPSCGSEGCANFYGVKYGEYYFWAENDYYEWEGELVVDTKCERMQLNVARASVKSNAPSGVSSMEPAVMDFDLNNIVNN